jgi:hypothetical protein
MASEHGQPHVRAGVNCLASRISDLVVRLRFLTVAAPVAEPLFWRKWRRVRRVVLLVLAGAANTF